MILFIFLLHIIINIFVPKNQIHHIYNINQ